MRMGIERPNILLLLAIFTDSFVGQQIIKGVVFRLNCGVALLVSYQLTLLILQLSRPLNREYSESSYHAAYA
jgi:hypothetical protein